MLLLTEADVSKIFRNLTEDQSQRLLKALRDSLTTYTAEASASPDSEKLLHQPLRSSIVTKYNDTTLFMPSSDTTNTGIKVVTLPAKGGAVGVINLFSPTGELLGLVAATEVTAFRTALATMSLLTLCTHISAKNIVVFGSGRQVEWHIRLALLLLPHGEIESFTIVNRGRERLDKLDQEVLSSLVDTYSNVKFKLVAKEDNPNYDPELRSALTKSDAIFCCTPSTEPLFPNSYIQAQKTRFISLIGSYKPHMKEIDTETLLSGGGTIFVDAKKACLEESGELRDANATEDQLIEIGGLFDKQSDLSEFSNIIFKCVGMGIMDLVIGRTLTELAKENGLGTNVDW
ncbi:hypothetical protein TRVA0_002S03466 [Trichomonascus vanleenenianus]|uniref:uncharacterized protein n=1 Tax=Trichomonascus vanleenenianus TaxID=2268995 RepID=UPI003ECB4640